MADSNVVNLLNNAIRRTLWSWALPRLMELRPEDWDDALRRARDADFDMVERIGILAGIAFVTYVLRFDPVQAEMLSLPARYFIQFLAAVPLLALVVGPFYLRRTRRGLDQEIDRRRGPNPSDSQR